MCKTPTSNISGNYVFNIIQSSRFLKKLVWQSEILNPYVLTSTQSWYKNTKSKCKGQILYAFCISVTHFSAPKKSTVVAKTKENQYKLKHIFKIETDVTEIKLA